MDRRKFLLDSCRVCAAVAAVPALAALESCGGAKAVTMEPAAGSTTIDVPLSQFGDAAYTVVKSKKVGDDLIIAKQPDGSYVALVKRCTHKGGPVNMDGADLKCSWHGSRFSLNGSVVTGPASTPLKSYPATLEGTVVRVDLGA
ncbi:MAG: Rieske (2Fe-2S) protein [Flavobacteriales bacterium]|nr:Rieske (2Fe-2S) protein [Flavobacteriales bacterium]MBK9195030.1 Rieske (2Fe-2S) protein [Flavobacteriales bacterium]MBP6574549.1 Rieske (2Fe-2S) protein [Flavobacteriales bacterium]